VLKLDDNHFGGALQIPSNSLPDSLIELYLSGNYFDIVDQGICLDGLFCDESESESGNRLMETDFEYVEILGNKLNPLLFKHALETELRRQSQNHNLSQSRLLSIAAEY
jgi:hypothetical protein